jgi:hypothetical protein
MKNTAFGLLTVLLLGGCADSGTDAKPANVADTERKPATQSAASESLPEATVAAFPLDAKELFNSTLVSAKTHNKRVIVHLGAPW